MVVVGMSDVVIVDTADALLVTNRRDSQKVKKAVDQLAARKRREVVQHQWLITDWGRVGTLFEGDGFSLKQLIVVAGAGVSVQPLPGKQVLLTIAEGEGVVRTGSSTRAVASGDTVEVASGISTTISNTGIGDLQAVEVTSNSPLPGDQTAGPIIEIAAQGVSAEARQHAA